jgi:benzodiazapine receptor
MNRDTARQIAVWAGLIATIVVNGLANALPINNQTSGDIANQYLGQNLWLPAGYVFSIWGLIYAGLIAYAVYQSLPSQRENPRLRRVGWLFVVSCVANMTWLLFFHYNRFPLSMVTMLVLLAALIAIYLVLGRNQIDVPAGERWAVRLPFSIYLGWITVATIANAAHVLVHAGWKGGPFGALAWLIIMYLVALALAAVVALTRRDIAFLLVMVWAFIGIAVNYSDMTGVMISSTIAALAVGIMAALVAARSLWRGKVYN